MTSRRRAYVADTENGDRDRPGVPWPGGIDLLASTTGAVARDRHPGARGRQWGRSGARVPVAGPRGDDLDVAEAT